MTTDGITGGMTDLERITILIGETAMLVGAHLSQIQIATLARELRIENQFTVIEIRDALQRCKRECSGSLTLKQILDRIPKAVLQTNEAWEFALRNRVWDRDQNLSQVSRAIIEAFPFSIWNGGKGDRIGARMAFIESYPKMLSIYEDEVVEIRPILPPPNNDQDKKETTLEINDPEGDIEAIEKIISEMNKDSPFYESLKGIGEGMINKRKKMLKKD